MSRTGLVVVSFLAGLVLLPLAIVLYLVYGKPPVATADEPFPLEAKIVKIPLHARIKAEMPANSPVQATDDNLNAGASIYEDKCENCHGVTGEPSSIGDKMFPPAPQLWAKKKSGAVGVSNDPVGAIYWKIKNGIRLSGMPAYEKVLTEQQLWQVTLLLAHANQRLPAEAAHTVGQQK